MMNAVYRKVYKTNDPFNDDSEHLNDTTTQYNRRAKILIIIDDAILLNIRYYETFHTYNEKYKICREEYDSMNLIVFEHFKLYIPGNNISVCIQWKFNLQVLETISR